MWGSKPTPKSHREDPKRPADPRRGAVPRLQHVTPATGRGGAGPTEGRGREVGRQRNAVGGGGARGAPPRAAPPPRRARTPLAPARADRTRRNRPPRGRSPPLAGPRARPRPAAGRPRQSRPRAPGRRPTPLRPGGRRHLPPAPRPPPGPLAPRPYQLGGEPGRPSGIEKSRRWEVLGEGGTGLKGTTTSFQPGGGEMGGGGLDGARPGVASGLKEENAQEVCRAAAAFGFRVPFPQILPKSLIPPSPPRKSRRCLEIVT